MPFANSLVESLPMVAWVFGSFIVVALFLGGAALAIYAIYWLFFKMGKD
jgi:hypothetical protein